MPPHSYEAFFRSLNKGELAPVYYLYGVEDVLKDEAVRAILDRALDPSLRDFNFDQRSAAQLDPEEVHALCNTLPMMAERRVVVLRDVEGWKRKTRGRSEFLRYLERPSPETVVILIQGSGEEMEDKELARGAYTVRFDRLPSDRARKWLLHRAGNLGVNLEPEAAEHLVLAVGDDLGALASELDKLASLPAGDPVTAEGVGALVGVRHGETAWDWRDAVLDDQAARAASLLASVLAQPGVSGVKLVTMLGTALVGLGIARAHYDRGLRGTGLEGAVLKSLFSNRPTGLLGYKEEARRWSHWAPHWPGRRIRVALGAAKETDEALKSTTISDERGLLLGLVLRLAKWGDEKDGEDGEGGGKESRKDGRMSGSGANRGRQLAGQRAQFLFSAFSVLSVFSVLFTTPARAQTDSRLVDVVRHAQEGRSDSARIKVRRLLAATSPSDSLYPQIIYTQAMVASDANEMRRQLQRVAVEYSSSTWADDALLRLVQLDYASGNLDGSARNLERIRLDYPGSQLLPQAAYWAARTYFDQKNPELACRWIGDGLAGSRGNIELQNQLGYLDQRCAGVRASLAARAPADSQPAPLTTADSAGPSPEPPPAVAVPPRQPQATSNQPAPTPAATPPVATPTQPPPPVRPDTARPAGPPAAAQPLPSAGRFRIQVSAVRSRRTAEAAAARMRDRGLNAVMVEEGGLYKVRIGNYATRNEAIADLPNIKAQAGGSPFVVAEP